MYPNVSLISMRKEHHLFELLPRPKRELWSPGATRIRGDRTVKWRLRHSFLWPIDFFRKFKLHQDNFLELPNMVLLIESLKSNILQVIQL